MTRQQMSFIVRKARFSPSEMENFTSDTIDSINGNSFEYVVYAQFFLDSNYENLRNGELSILTKHANTRTADILHRSNTKLCITFKTLNEKA